MDLFWIRPSVFHLLVIDLFFSSLWGYPILIQFHEASMGVYKEWLGHSMTAITK